MADYPVINSMIDDFSENNEIDDLKNSEKFEHLTSWLLFSEFLHDRLSTFDVVTQDGETSIDSAIVVLDRRIITTAEDAEKYLESKPSSSVGASVCFLQSTLSDSFNREKVRGFGDAVFELLESQNVETPQDSYLYEIKEIFEVLKKYASKIDFSDFVCRLFYCCLGKWESQSHIDAARRRSIKDLKSIEFFEDVGFEVVDRNKIRQKWDSLNKEQEATLPTINNFAFPAMPDIDNAIVAVVRAKDFVDRVIRDGSGNVRGAIFDQNIRDFEGVDNPVNNSMKSTLESNEARCRFGVMNNGITVVSKEVTQAADSFVLRGYQIVNGCQTSNVLEHNRGILNDDVLVQVRLIQAESEKVLNDVVKATNSQTQVPEEQFVANKPMAVEVAQFFESYPKDADYRLYFERRKSQFSRDANISNTRVFGIQDLSKSIGAVFFEKPYLVAGSPNKSFDQFKDNLFDEEHSPLMYYTATFALYRFNLLKFNGKLKVPERRMFWHVLFYAKTLVSGRAPNLKDRKKVEAQCNEFLSNIWKVTDALDLFEYAYKEIVAKSGYIDRDKMKRSNFMQEYLGNN